MATKAQTLKGKAAVDVYRAAHALLSSGGWYEGLPETHTPLLEKLLIDLKTQGFNSLDEFFRASEELDKAEETTWQ